VVRAIALALPLVAAMTAVASAEEELSPTDVGTVEPAPPSPSSKSRSKSKKPRSTKRARSARRSNAWMFDSEAKVTALAGAFSGHGTIPDSGAALSVDASVEPSAERGRWRFALPLDAAHLQTFRAELSESKGAVGAEARFKTSPRFRLTATVGLAGVWRPDWPDLYQPTAAGLAGTDRYSHLDTKAGVEVAGIPLRHQHARLEWRYVNSDGKTDPAYDPVARPTHLVPTDYELHTVDVSWRYLADTWKLGGAVDLGYRHRFSDYARDAGTGRTHAGAGGPPPNPFYTAIEIEPSLKGEVAIGERGHVGLGYGLEIVSDRYAGYYSYTGHHPEAEVELPVGPGTLEVDLDVRWRTYGANSYAAGAGHPALEYGDRRVDHRFTATARMLWPITEQIALVAESALRVRRTNFPDYAPGVFPASASYDVDWDFTNWSLGVGAQARM